MLDVETKLDAVLRGNGINSGGLPAREGRRKDSVGTVSIISTPSEAMAAPKVKADDCDTWSGAPLAASLKSKASTQFSSASIASQGTQTSSASSQYSQTSHFPDTTEASAQVSQGPSNVSCKPAQPSKTWAAPSYSLHARHVSTPLHTVPSAALQTLKVPRHLSQQMPPRSASTPPTATKQLPALPHAFTDQAFSRPEPSKIHPPLRSTHSSTECLNPVSPYHEAVTTGSSLYSLSPVSPIDGGEKKMQPLHVDADMPSPLHFEKPIARMPARLLRQQTEFKIYVGEEV